MVSTVMPLVAVDAKSQRHDSQRCPWRHADIAAFKVNVLGRSDRSDIFHQMDNLGFPEEYGRLWANTNTGMCIRL